MTCPLSVQSEAEKHIIEKNAEKCDPLMPLSLFNPNDTFYINQYKT